MLTNLPHRITFCKNKPSPYFLGGATSYTVETVSTEWANVQRINMSNDRGNLKDQQMNFYNVTVRNAKIGLDQETINNKLFIMWGSKKLLINCGSDGSGRETYLKINCQEELV